MCNGSLEQSLFQESSGKLRVRYTTSDDGKPVKQAEVYTQDEHGITRSHIDRDALKVMRRLRESGHSAYVVGGAVRDLLLGKHPKDFDVATDASPSRIRKLFRNSRVIGKRFRLVHIHFRNQHIIEVSTFRAKDSEGFHNVYGGIEEDVQRRDFTLNALYYDPEEQTVLDYVGGVRDIRSGRLRHVIPLERIFEEDPVRMIRAIKYATTSKFNMVSPLRRQMKRSREALQDCSASRLTEEVFKILLSGYAEPIIRELLKYDMLPYILPQLDFLLQERSLGEFRENFFATLEDLDQLKETKEVTRAEAIAYLCGDFLFLISDFGKQRRVPFKEAFSEMKHFIRPVAPANRDVEQALVMLLRRRKRFLETGSLQPAQTKN
jgi:poly(A) polymerase